MIGRILFVSVLCATISGYPSGLPDEACLTRTPVHGELSLAKDSCPFMIVAEPWKAGEFVRVGIMTVDEKDRSQFMGFAAAVTLDEEPIGTMRQNEDLNRPRTAMTKITCDDTTLTHEDDELKKEIIFEWEAPEDLDSTTVLHLRLTIVGTTTAEQWVDCNVADTPNYLSAEASPDFTTDADFSATEEAVPTTSTTETVLAAETVPERALIAAETVPERAPIAEETAPTTTTTASTSATTTGTTASTSTTPASTTTASTTTASTTTASTTTAPATTQAAVPQEVTATQAVVTEPSTTQAVVTEPSTTQAVVTEPSTTQAFVTEPSTTQAFVTEATTTEAVFPDDFNTTEAITQEPTTTEPRTPEPTTTEPRTAEPTTTEVITPETKTRPPTTTETIVSVPADKSEDKIPEVDSEDTGAKEFKPSGPADSYLEYSMKMGLKHHVMSDMECEEGGVKLKIIEGTECGEYEVDRGFVLLKYKMKCPMGKNGRPIKFDPRVCACADTSYCPAM